MSDRVRTIIQSEQGRTMPELAEALAFEASEISAEVALKLLAAAAKDVAAATAEASATINTAPAGGHFGGQQTSLGVADRVGGDNNAEAIKAGWAKALARHNATV